MRRGIKEMDFFIFTFLCLTRYGDWMTPALSPMDEMLSENYHIFINGYGSNPAPEFLCALDRGNIRLIWLQNRFRRSLPRMSAACAASAQFNDYILVLSSASAPIAMSEFEYEESKTHPPSPSQLDLCKAIWTHLVCGTIAPFGCWT